MATTILSWDASPPDACRNGALTIGNFDGVHRGHTALITQVQRRAAEMGGRATVLTFDPHPLQLLRPEHFQPVLTTPADRAELLHACGADEVVMLRTNRELLQLRAREFFERVIRSGFAARALVEGDNFGFGRDREGTVDTLRTYCRDAGIGLDIVSPVEVNGVRVSSSRVREALVRGDVHNARVLLGRPYRLRGIVGSGARRGQTLGFPTANLERVETLVPGNGVYAVQVPYGGQTWPGAANVGPNPTFGEQARKIEVHVIGFQGDLYGQPLTVEFCARLRDTRPFAGVEQLVGQLRADVDQAQRLIAESEKSQ
jgi:riboflavin kinase / FMN adenylyltransferase